MAISPELKPLRVWLRGPKPVSPREGQQPAPACAAGGTFGALPFASMIPPFHSPELKKHSGVGLDDLLLT